VCVSHTNPRWTRIAESFKGILYAAEVAAMFRLVPGGRQQGLVLREQMLREGTVLTAVGAVSSDGNRLKVFPPQGKPYVLSAHTFEEIRRQVHTEWLFYK